MLAASNTNNLGGYKAGLLRGQEYIGWSYFGWLSRTLLRCILTKLGYLQEAGHGLSAKESSPVARRHKINLNTSAGYICYDVNPAKFFLQALCKSLCMISHLGASQLSDPQLRLF